MLFSSISMEWEVLSWSDPAHPKNKSEDEQAAVIYWMMNLYLEHGAEWRDEAEKIMASGV